MVFPMTAAPMSNDAEVRANQIACEVVPGVTLSNGRIRGPLSDLHRWKLAKKAALLAFAAEARSHDGGWEAMRDGLEEIVRWSEAYPLRAFPEPDLVKAAEVLKAAGMTLDAISASNFRHVLNGVTRIAREALSAVPLLDEGRL